MFLQPIYNIATTCKILMPFLVRHKQRDPVASFDRKTGYLLWQLAWPLILANLGIPLLGLTDSFAAGHLDNASHLGAVILGANVINIIFWGLGFLRMGTTSLVAQAIGRYKRYHEAYVIFVRALVLACCLALAIWLITPLIGYYGLDLIGATEQVNALARTYFFIVVCSAPFHLSNLVTTGWFVGTGKTRSMLYMTIVITFSNIILNLIFVFVLKLGVQGIAGATVIAQIIGFTCFTVPTFLKGARIYKLPTFASILMRESLVQLYKMNLDLWLRTIMLMAGLFLINIIAAQLGDVALATTGVLMTFFLIGSYVLDGFAVASESLAGKAYGAKDISNMVPIARTTFIISAYIATLISFVLIAITPMLIDFITHLELVQNLAMDYYLWVCLLPLSGVWCFVFDGLFLGCAKTRALRNCMLVSTVIYAILAILFSFLWGLHGLWASIHIFMWLRALTLAASFTSLLESIKT